MKIFEKVLDFRLRKLVHVTVEQFGFVPGKSCTDANLEFRKLQVKYSEKKGMLSHNFVDL